MEYKDIIKVLKGLDITVSQFAHEDYGASDDFVFDEEKVAQVKLAKEEAYKIYKESGAKYGSEEYKTYVAVPSEYDERNRQYFESIGLGEIQEIEQYGGEDMGSTWYSVKYFPKHDIYIKVDGWYQSYNGTEFSDWSEACSEVRSTTKTIQVFEKI